MANFLCALCLAGCSRTAAPLPQAKRSDLTLTAGHLARSGQTAPFTGFMVEHYPNGALKSRSAVREGRLDGLSEGWHTNGQLQVREFFKAGVADGIRSKWREDGTRLSEATIVAGKLEGSFRRWHENGALAEEFFMRQDLPDGVARAFYPSGCLKAEVQVKRGATLERKRWADGEHPGAPLTAANP